MHSFRSPHLQTFPVVYDRKAYGHGRGRITVKIMRYNTNEYREIMDIIIPEGEN